MGSVFAILAGALMTAGVCAAALGFVSDPVTGPTRANRRPARFRWRQIRQFVKEDRNRLMRAGVAAGAGLVGWIFTGWPVAAVVIFVAVIVLPSLLSHPPNRDLELLSALDRWVRSLNATLATGVSIPEAIRNTRRHVPDQLRDNVTALIARLDDRWTPRQALETMADELASPDADAILAALILSAERGGVGAVATLAALADSVQDRLKAGREIEVERAKPRIVVRQVTIVTVSVLAAALLFGNEFFAPYGTWYGQIILAALIGMYLLSLVWLRRITTPRPRERILQ